MFEASTTKRDELNNYIGLKTYLGKEGTRNYIHVDYKNKCSSLVKIFFFLRGIIYVQIRQKTKMDNSKIYKAKNHFDYLSTPTIEQGCKVNS